MNELEIKRTPDVIGAEIRSLTNQARYITLWNLTYIPLRQSD